MIWLLLGCNDAGVKAYNTAPAVSIVTPADGDSVDPGALVEFYGIARDEQDLGKELTVRWESSLDGLISSDPPDINGDLMFSTNSLTGGEHVITLTAADTGGQSASTSILLNVGESSQDPGGPAIVILSPSEGSQVGASSETNLLATVADDIDPSESLYVEVVDVPDGTLWTGYPAATGTLDIPMDPSLGAHSLTINALDLEGKKGSATVNFEVVQDNVPIVNITSPADGTTADNIDILTFKGSVSDDTTPVEMISCTWSSDIAGVLSSASPDSSGITSFGGTLSAGVHVITLHAVDQEGDEGRDTITLSIEDPLARDDDGDGYTEYEGDCDDTDDTYSPAESDLCNDDDEDCDGYVNDPYFDTYEVNNSIGSPYDLGEVDNGLLWTGSTVDLSGLTFSDEADEDWFRWDADDEYWDNVDVSIVVSDLDSSGDYVVELYNEDGTVIGSDSGDGSLGVEYYGDALDDDEDVFYVRVYAVNWPTNSCGNAYKLRIRS